MWNLSHNIHKRMCDIQHKNHAYPKNQLPLIALFYPLLPYKSPVPTVAPDRGISLPCDIQCIDEIILFYFEFSNHSYYFVLSKARKEKSSLVVLNPHSSGLSRIQNNSISLFLNIALSLIMQFLLFYILSRIQLYSIMSVTPNPSNSPFWSFKRFSAAQLYPYNANRDSLISKCRLPPTD